MAFDLLPHFFFALPDGELLRYAQFAPTGTPRGTVLIVPGRREFIEKKYGELGQPLLDAGLRVVIVEMRNQGLSGRFLSGAQRQRDHISDFKIHLDDLRAFYAASVQPHVVGPLIVHGHSLGGHIVIRWLAEDRPAVVGCFLTAPMLALAGMPTQLAAYGLSWLGVNAFGHATDYAPTQHDYDAKDREFLNNPLTQDPERFKTIEDYFAARPDLIVGGVTWGWMLAALKSMHATHAWPYLTRIDIPVLALVGDQDRVTPGAEISRYLNMIPRVRTHIIAQARHDLLNETNFARQAAWGHINGFLRDLPLP